MKKGRFFPASKSEHNKHVRDMIRSAQTPIEENLKVHHSPKKSLSENFYCELKNSEMSVLDLTKKGLKKIPKTEDSQSIKCLILDENELQKVDNIDSYLRIEKLSLKHNQLLRMYGVSRLHNLRELNLSYNGILTIEALKECLHLTHLNLEGNSIKTIEHLNTNLKLEYLNLGENSIGIISDISFLKQLKELYLHSNRISHLRQCEKYLPTSLEILTLNKNNMADLNEISALSNLANLMSITIADNPCVQMIGSNSIFDSSGFDYRPFLLNWCMSVKVIDGYVVNPIESLRAEWLFSQGKGRSFRIGEHQALVQYLSQTCPLSGETLENENERKLRLILSKAQQHQRQLQEESPTSSPNNSSTNNSPSSNRRKTTSRIQSPRVSRLSGHHRPSTADAVMSSSFHGTIKNFTSDSIMTQSLDPTILGGASINTSMNSSMTTSMLMKELNPSPINNGNLYNEQSNVPIMHTSGPLITASKMMPVPETLMSPDCPPITIQQQQQRPVSNLTSSSSAVVNIAKTTSRVTNQQRPSSSPATTKTSRIARKTEKSSPSNSPRKSLVNTANTKIHQNQSILKTSQQTSLHSTIEQQSMTTQSSVVTTEDEDEDELDHMNVEKLKAIKKVAQKNQKQMENHQQLQKSLENKEAEKSAILIQKLWRGYSTRKQTSRDLADSLQQKRTNDYIMKLTQDMEMTKQALENERKIQQLQMQAINALWKKVSTMQPVNEHGPAESTTIIPSGDTTTIVQDLTKTCSMLTNQVQQLQLSMRDILNCMTVFANLPQMQQSAGSSSMTMSQFKDSSETQTEIIAVHTPQVEHKDFPFVIQQRMQRPSSLPINNSSSNETSMSTKSSQNNTATTTDEIEIANELNGEELEASAN
ncbi:centrosomal protein of 97 kDa isoform X3 [Chironomus tepperi]|uniref:centrosomal protein of 97 kDa isoform X3 n=1 Tax=Chironomus tepperi TaxID=113505 RepID=UPI00391F0E09